MYVNNNQEISVGNSINNLGYKWNDINFDVLIDTLDYL